MGFKSSSLCTGIKSPFSGHPSALVGFLQKNLFLQGRTREELSSSLGEAVGNWQKKESEPRLPLQVAAKCTLSARVPCIQTGACWHSALGSCSALALTGHLWVSPKPGSANFQLLMDLFTAVLLWEKRV